MVRATIKGRLGYEWFFQLSAVTSSRSVLAYVRCLGFPLESPAFILEHGNVVKHLGLTHPAADEQRLAVVHSTYVSLRHHYKLWYLSSALPGGVATVYKSTTNANWGRIKPTIVILLVRQNSFALRQMPKEVAKLHQRFTRTSVQLATWSC